LERVFRGMEPSNADQVRRPMTGQSSLDLGLATPDAVL